jgi:hypothetical protein
MRSRAAHLAGPTAPPGAEVPRHARSGARPMGEHAAAVVRRLSRQAAHRRLDPVRLAKASETALAWPQKPAAFRRAQAPKAKSDFQQAQELAPLPRRWRCQGQPRRSSRQARYKAMMRDDEIAIGYRDRKQTRLPLSPSSTCAAHHADAQLHFPAGGTCNQNRARFKRDDLERPKTRSIARGVLQEFFKLELIKN